MDPIVVIDLETTGLDPEKDAIIEIGAVRFTDRRVEGEWNSLINPGRRIPPFITQLTGYYRSDGDTRPNHPGCAA